MSSNELCSKCKGLDLHDLLEETYELWSEDKSRELSNESENDWHSNLEDLTSSSSHCHLCRLVLRALEDDLQAGVDELVRSGDMSEENQSEYAGGLLKTPKFAQYQFTVELSYDSEGIKSQNTRAFLKIILKPDPPYYSSWDPGDVMAMFSIVASNPTTDAQAILCREVDVDPASDPTFAQIQTWLENCTKNHENCPKDDSIAQMPTRILEVGDMDSGMVYLRESSALPEKSAPYVALSHCWGVEQTMKKLMKEGDSSLGLSRSSSALEAYWKVRKASQTTIESLPEKLRGVPVKALPQTAQDAILITRKLGLSYLWIDSLCIIQDDKEDWLRESGRMADVYLNAYLVVGAANSFADYDGFLQKRPEPDMVKFNQTLSDGTSAYLGLQPLLPKPRRWAAMMSEGNTSVDPLGSEPLAQRAWCLQERYLARRMVLYGTTQVFWECAELLTAQNGDFVDRGEDYLQELKATASIQPTIFEPRPDGDDRVNYRAWYKMVEKYTSCAITQGSDRLPALAGLASAVASSSGDEYWAGIWRKGMIEGLLWSRAESDTDSLERPDKYRGPSWSWISVEGKVQFTVYNLIQRCSWKARIADYEALATYVDHKLTTDPSNPYGGVKDGYLRLTAPLLKVTSMQLSEPNPLSDVMVPFTSPGCDRVLGLSIGSKVMYVEGGFDTDGDYGDNLSVLLLARLPDGTDGFDIFLDLRFGLIVQPTGEEGVYRRVGIVDGPVLAHKSEESWTTRFANVVGIGKETRSRWDCDLFSPDHALYHGDDGPLEMPQDPLPEFKSGKHMATATLI
ncbi:heterokaryon incompatibility protein-domain-containing protein [Xylogone sp. PMI_703]|nr:heterokaryon incompatibility protein-domain-containing protein [Xylogone sp. PMI_703]